METEAQEIICPVCAARTVFAFQKNGFSLYRCASCRHELMHPQPKINALEELYGQDYFAGRSQGFGYTDYNRDKEVMRAVFERKLGELEARRGGKGRLLDVGAATGFFVSIAQDRGFEAKGVEISAFAAKVGRDRGLDIVEGTIETLEAEAESFDVITLFDVVEHMTNPKASLGRVYALLKPEGLIVLNTPDSGSVFARMLGRRWHLYVPPEHLHYFNQKSMRLMLEEIGFKEMVFSKVGKRFTLLYVLETLYTWQKLSFWKKCISAIKRFPRLATLSLPIHLFDNMYVVARK